MAEEQQEIPQEKKREYKKTIYLFGIKISVPCSSLESNETVMPIAKPEKQTGPYTITKTLFMSEVNSNYRLTVEKYDAETHIVRHLSADAQEKIQQGLEVDVKVYDDDEETEHALVFKRLVESSKCYIFNGGWTKHFVKRRNLKVGDTIGLYWDKVDSILHFSVRQKKKT